MWPPRLLRSGVRERKVSTHRFFTSWLDWRCFQNRRGGGAPLHSAIEASFRKVLLSGAAEIQVCACNLVTLLNPASPRGLPVSCLARSSTSKAAWQAAPNVLLPPAKGRGRGATVSLQLMSKRTAHSVRCITSEHLHLHHP